MPYLPRNTERRPWQGQLKPAYWKGVKKTAFYSNRPWRRTRLAKLQANNFMCEQCTKKGVITEATEVHHIKPINQEDPYNTQGGKFGEPLSFINLMTLCFTCHTQIQNKKS